MVKRRTWILLGAIALFCAAFLLLNFHAAVSNTQADMDKITTTSGDRLPDAMQRQDKVRIALVGEGLLGSALQKSLVAEMQKAGIGEIELVEVLETGDQNPVLVVKVDPTNILWTPFFGTSHFRIEAGYASNGDTTFMDGMGSVYNSEDGPALHMSADYEVSDRSWGLISLPGYHQLLADYLAKQIAAAVKDLYAV